MATRKITASFPAIPKPLAVIGVSLIYAVIFGSLMAQVNFSGRTLYNEMGHHLQFAQQMEESGRVVMPHFLFHILAILVHKAVLSIEFPLPAASADPYVDNSWLAACVIILTIVYVAIALILVRYIKRVIKKDLPANFIALSLAIVQPIFLFIALDGKYYLGYITPSNLYIIPTQTLLKLTSLGLFMLTPVFFRKSVSPMFLLAILVLVVANGLSKPNYLIIALPALTVFLAFSARKGRKINCRALSVYVASSVLLLAWQYHFKFANPDAPIYQSSVTLTAPFDVLSHLSDYAPAKLLLSLVFPLYIAVAYRDRVFRDDDVVYAWILMFFGLLFAIFVSETGEFQYAANFVWSAQIANFLLFAASARYFFGYITPTRRALSDKYVLGCIVFGLHVLCGVIFYVRSFEFSYV